MERFPEVQAIFDAAEQSGPYQSIDDLNRALSALTEQYNRQPQAALGGLSPEEVAQLLYGDWISAGALRLNEELTFEDLSGAALLADAQTLLAYVHDHAPVKETSAHNLPRAVIAALLPRLRMPTERRLALPLAERKPMNEADVLWLGPLRYILIFAGLIMRRKGLRLTTLGKRLLPVERVGTLYALLFRTLFPTLDLRALSRDGRHPGLQSTIAYSFYKLRECAADWTSAEMLAQRAWLDSAKDPASEVEAAAGDLRHYTFRHRVLEPLTQCGLLEERPLPAEVWWKDTVEYRRTPLFDRFLKFRFR